MFIMAAALITANETGRRVVVNSKQSAVHSFGAPQPVFWHTIFHSPHFVKEDHYHEAGADVIDDEQFFIASADQFKEWRHARSIVLSGPFLRFDVNIRYRELLLQVFEPTGEVQRWVNDAALKLGLANPSKDIPSSLAASEFDAEYAGAKLAERLNDIAPIPKKARAVSWCTSPDPKSCEKDISRLFCKSASCEDNIALHLRLQDSSSSVDYWSQDHLKRIKKYLRYAIEERDERRVVIFSNDVKRAKALMESDDSFLSEHIEYSNNLDVVEFFLMSQYFGTHVLTPQGSTFQHWALFLSDLTKVKVLTLPGKTMSLEDLAKLPHVIVKAVGGTSVNTR